MDWRAACGSGRLPYLGDVGGESKSKEPDIFETTWLLDQDTVILLIAYHALNLSSQIEIGKVESRDNAGSVSPGSAHPVTVLGFMQSNRMWE